MTTPSNVPPTTRIALPLCGLLLLTNLWTLASLTGRAPHRVDLRRWLAPRRSAIEAPTSHAPHDALEPGVDPWAVATILAAAERDLANLDREARALAERRRELDLQCRAHRASGGSANDRVDRHLQSQRAAVESDLATNDASQREARTLLDHLRATERENAPPPAEWRLRAETLLRLK